MNYLYPLEISLSEDSLQKFQDSPEDPGNRPVRAAAIKAREKFKMYN